MSEENGNQPKPLRFEEKSDENRLTFPAGFGVGKGFKDGNLYRLDKREDGWELVPTTLVVEQSRQRLAAATATPQPDWNS